jgi:mannose-1-phosphate guanylyltransferase
MSHSRRWGVILAGGDGKRLRPLTRLVTGDDRPKQFCPLLDGGKTLLDQTRLRTARVVSTGQTLFVLNRCHRNLYRRQLRGVPSSRLVVQPANRGTLPAILWSLARVLQLDERAIVGFFPSDHYYSREEVFVRGVVDAYDLAQEHPESVILLGAEPSSPETGYGYIEPAGPPARSLHPHLAQVVRFWEKPSADIASRLIDCNCLWNTFVMVGAAGAFLDLIRSTAPELYQAFEPALRSDTRTGKRETFTAVYARIPAFDFSGCVLVNGMDRLRVLNLGDAGWSDLGDPERILSALSPDEVAGAWRDVWHHSAAAASVSG